MFSIIVGTIFYASWDYDKVNNPNCAGFIGRILDSNGGVVAQQSWIKDPDMRKAACGCHKTGIFSFVVQAIDTSGKEGLMSVPVPINVVAKPETPQVPPPPPNTTLTAPTNVRLSIT